MYAGSGALCWAAAGLLLGSLPLRLAALIVVVAYGAYYGTTEALGVRGAPAPGSRWQVPQQLVVNASRRRRVLVWGGILGPGFLTRNPYAGFGMLLALVALASGARDAVIVALVIGIAHGTGRALALLRDARQASGAEYLTAVARSFYWRQCDGLALLLIAACVLAARQGFA